MGKKFVIGGFLICCALAVWAFSIRDVRSLRQGIDQKDREPRVVLEDFVGMRFEGDRLVSQVSARLGHLFEPNEIALDGDVKAERQTPDGRETFSAESAVGFFEADSLTSLLRKSAVVERVELTGFVEVGLKEHTLSTDAAVYWRRKGTISSSRAVRVEGPNRVFTGDEGFVYDIESQAMRLPGRVHGVVAVDDTK